MDKVELERTGSGLALRLAIWISCLKMEVWFGLIAAGSMLAKDER